MTSHIHAALMKQYYEDALETETPWEWWEYRYGVDKWITCSVHPVWDLDKQYRRKPIALCQVEGRDVFPGDKLWHKYAGWVTATKQGYSSDHVCVDKTLQILITRLSWTEPARTKTVYQWAILRPNESRWFVSDWLYSTEQEVREQVVAKEVRRLDWTALEVPA